MGALLRLPGSTPGWGGQQAHAEPLTILRPKTLSIQQHPPCEIGNIVGGASAPPFGRRTMAGWRNGWRMSNRRERALTPLIGVPNFAPRSSSLPGLYANVR